MKLVKVEISVRRNLIKLHYRIENSSQPLKMYSLAIDRIEDFTFCVDYSRINELTKNST